MQYSANALWTISLTRLLFATRCGFVAIPGVSGSSSKPSQNRFQSPSLPTAICTAPSAVSNKPYGEIEGWWLPAASPTWPATVHFVP